MRIGVVVLAGGEGIRIGGNKPGRLLMGRPLLDHVLERVRLWSADLALSVQEDAVSDEDGDFARLPDREGRGPIAGIASALRFAAERKLDAVLTVPCDTPFLPQDLPRRLALALGENILAAIAASGGRTHPSCALWSARAAKELPAYLETRRSSLHGFAQRLGAATVEWPAEPFDPFFNVNTPADLAAAEALIRSR